MPSKRQDLQCLKPKKKEIPPSCAFPSLHGVGLAQKELGDASAIRRGKERLARLLVFGDFVWVRVPKGDLQWPTFRQRRR